jgi:hypothetical protein
MNGLLKTVAYNTKEYYSVINKKEIMSFARKWMEVEFIMLREISQTQKNKC